MTIERRAFILGASHAAMSGAALWADALISPASSATTDPITSQLLPTGAVSRFADVNDIRLHYVTMGTGPAVVLLHGWPQTWFAWRGVMQRLSSRFTLIAPDLRGIGLSERTVAGYDKRTIAADIGGLIAHAANGRAHVVAHDMGGKAAYMLAHLHPERLDRLVLVDCLVPGTENTDALRGGAWHYGFHMAPDIPELLTRGRERDYIAAQIRTWSRRKDAVSEAAISEFARHYATPGGMTAGFNYYRALHDDSALAMSFNSQALEMPILTIGGAFGVATKLADAIRPQARQLTEAIAPDSGHFVAEEVPDFFCARIAQFLSS